MSGEVKHETKSIIQELKLTKMIWNNSLQK